VKQFVHTFRALDELPTLELMKDESDEGISDNHRHGFWFDHSGAYLAYLRGGITPCDGPRVSSPYFCCRRSMFLGVALALALITLMMRRR